MRVRIYRPSKSAAQSGRALERFWVIEPENATPRLPEPIMGWVSAQDAFSGLRGRLKFPSLDDALAFTRGKGWDLVALEPQEEHIEPRNYLNNFNVFRPEDEERFVYEPQSS